LGRICGKKTLLRAQTLFVSLKFTQTVLESSPSTRFVGRPFLVRTTLDSSNRFALDWIATKTRPEDGDPSPAEGTAIMALEQPGGRGQYGTTWVTEPGAGLALSVIFYPGFLPAREAFRLNVALSLGIWDAMRGLVSLPAGQGAWHLKWPNDLYAGFRKVAGLLLENGIANNHLTYSVLGIGLNVNQVRFPAELPNPVSLRQLDGQQRDLQQVAFRICEALEPRYEQLRQGAWLALKRQYLQALWGYGEKRRFQRSTPAGPETFEGVIAGVEDSGELAIDCGGTLKRFRFKEVVQLGE